MRIGSARFFGVAILGAAIALVVAYGVRRALAAGIPTTTPLYYSGYLEQGGSPLTGPHLIQVNLWTDATSTNTSKRVCTTVPVGSTTVTAGRFRLPLDPTCLAAIHAHPDLYVEVVVDGTTLPRTKIGAVPYAVEADTASHAAGPLLAKVSAAASATMTNPKTGAKITVNGVYCGSTASHDGNLGGYAGAKTMCETACGASTAHMCFADEIVRTATLGLKMPTAESWVAGEAGVIDSNEWAFDCAGYQTNGGNPDAGITVTGGGGGFFSRYCNASYPVACCN